MLLPFQCTDVPQISGCFRVFVLILHGFKNGHQVPPSCPLACAWCAVHLRRTQMIWTSARAHGACAVTRGRRKASRFLYHVVHPTLHGRIYYAKVPDKVPMPDKEMFPSRETDLQLRTKKLNRTHMLLQKSALNSQVHILPDEAGFTMNSLFFFFQAALVGLSV